ncbi:MAG: hypothetical protein K9J16_10530 [Melioribacteraceae bacterium]|nr:hypothetical protein [Melioribacteraceae bacterium]MCF8354474.1 hypothetical protein [Melioribacteraceae bacterium]MCF8394084.1 hypothetical protein [Melioribacteraceae bacterium]MCF8419863.1 hypothetical protein [Melioribacteraceae bacterium]
MTNTFRKVVLFIFPIFFFSACANVTDMLYLQDVSVYAPINQPPINIVNSDSSKHLIISPRIFINGSKNFTGKVDGHTYVNDKGIFQVDTSFTPDGFRQFNEPPAVNIYEYSEDNLNWYVPDFSAGFDIDFKANQHFSITSGVSVSQLNQESLYSWKLGAGFSGMEGNFGLRLDAGVIWSESIYYAETVLIRNSGTNPGEVFFFVDKAKTTNADHYFSINLSYEDGDLPINPFIGFTYSRQTILDIEPRNLKSPIDRRAALIKEDFRGTKSIGSMIITPGVYIKISDWNRLLFGIRIFNSDDIRKTAGGSIVVPMIQLDLIL